MLNISSVESDRTTNGVEFAKTMAQGVADLRAQRAAEAAAMEFPWDITSPEGLIAFFGEKMKSTNTDLKALMQAQQNRSQVVKNIGLMNALLGTDGKDLKPGSDNWPEFERLAKLVGPSLGLSDDAIAVQATLNQATSPVHAEDTFKRDNEGGQADFRKAHPHATVVEDPDDGTRVKLSSDLEGPGLDGGATKELNAKLKALSENLQSDNQMDAIRVQELVGRISQIMSLASNILHKFDEAKMAPIQNIK
jgi:hypothetical protein